MTVIDTSNCETEPIRFPGAVLPHGALLVLEQGSGMIEAVSESCLSILGLHPEHLLGQPFERVFGVAAADAVQSALGDGQQPVVNLALYGKDLRARPRTNAAGQVLVDIEVAFQHSFLTRKLIYACRSELIALRKLNEIPAIAQGAAELLRRTTGYDRVMIYRFDQAWNGEVIAEARIDGIEPFLGLNYPASDIPSQARELFQLCRVRLIPDVLYTPSDLIARGDAQAIDLGLSSLRNVSPMHIEYLVNMGVRATLVGALVVEGRLWGLAACHQMNEPKYFGPDEQDVLAWLCEDIAALIETALIRQGRDRQSSLATRRRLLLDTLRAVDFKVLMRQKGSTELLEVVGADGFALLDEKSVQTTGNTPTLDRIWELQQRRRACESDPNLFSTNSLTRDLGVDDAGDGVAGALFVSVNNKPGITMIWFRQERSHSVRWAGDPENMRLADENGRLSPRKSFAQFLQEVRGQCLAWTPEELASAAELGSLIEVEALREREAFAQTILNSIPEHLCVLDSQGVITAVNNSWKQFAEQNEASEHTINSVGLNYRNICKASADRPGGDLASAAWAGIEGVLNKTLVSFALDYPCDSPNERRWFRMCVYPMIAPCEGAVVTHENVTESKLATIRLDNERTQLRTLLATIPDLVWLKNMDGVYLMCNPEFERFFGAREADIAGKTDYDFVPSALADLFRQNDLEAVTRGSPRVNEEWINYASDGHRALLETTKSAMHDAQGRLIGVLGIAHDITARNLAETELLRSNSELEQFSYAISHDMRQPLRMISSYLQLLEMGLGDQLDSEKREFFNFAIDGAKRLDTMMVGLLDYSRVGRKGEPTVWTESRALLDEALRFLQPAMAEAQAEVRCTGEWPQVQVSPDEMLRLMQNLIGNALKFRVAGRVPSISVNSEVGTDYWRFSVSDNGIGILPEQIGRLFQVFQRLHSRSAYEGTGIGLALCRKIAEHHGGRIRVESEGEGKGSTFVVELPMICAATDHG